MMPLRFYRDIGMSDKIKISKALVSYLDNVVGIFIAQNLTTSDGNIVFLARE
jgi:hypothetical protein